LFQYVSDSPLVPVARGRSQQLDLSHVLLKQKNSADVYDTAESFVEACRSPGVLLTALGELSRVLLHTLVIILDQAEEVITQTTGKDESRRSFFQFLREFAASDINLKLIIALRKEYFADFFEPMQFDSSIKSSDIKSFQLVDLTKEEVLDAIVRPTETDATKFPKGIGAPFNLYRFSYGLNEGRLLSEVIAEELFEAAPSGGVLPAMQIVCRELYDDVRRGAGPEEARTIDEALYARGGRVAGRINRHISKLDFGHYAA
jgi:hypothetical protein